MTRPKITSGRHVPPSRRKALGAALAAGTAALAGCEKPVAGGGGASGGGTGALAGVPKSMKQLKSGANDVVERINHAVHRTVAGRQALAQEFTRADVRSHFQSNGTLQPPDAEYKAMQADGFRDWRLQVGGLVEQPTSWSLDELRAMPSRTQITRHDCVEGWSSIGQWKGVPLHRVLAQVRPKPAAKYVVFHCADSMNAALMATGRDSKYYESIDMDDAMHVQTLLAYELNDQPLPVNNGAPLRLRVERQLGYKHAKYLMRIELVDSFKSLRDGKGGYWEDLGYEWYAGI